MSATKSGCKQQVWRVMTFCKAAKDDESQTQVAREILEALLRNCQSDEHAGEVVTKFIETPHFPGDIIADLVSIARATQKFDQPPAGCEDCAIGPDITTGEMRWSAHVTGTRPDGATFAQRCSCVRGAWYRNADASPRTDPKRPGRSKSDFRKLASGDDAA